MNVRDAGLQHAGYPNPLCEILKIQRNRRRRQTELNIKDLVEYTVLAWAYVSATPVWENPAHNNTRRTCFKSLAASAMTALKKGSFTRDQVEDIKKKMLKLREGSDEINICIKHIEESY